jgi:hypothetical protein
MKLFEPAKKSWQKEWQRRSKPIFILVLLLLVGAFVLLLINPVNYLILYLVSASFIIRSIEIYFRFFYWASFSIYGTTLN